MSSLTEIYRYHHTNGNRIGRSTFKDVRSCFLRDRIGTNKKVLDIGCRDGVLTKTYCEGNDVLGIDIDTDALALAEKNLGIKTQSFDLGVDWPLQESMFDYVVAGEVLEHLYFPDKVIERAARVLVSGGSLIGSVPNAFSLRNRLRLLCAQKQNTPLHDPTHINHFSRSELIGLLEKSFKEVKITTLGRYPFLDKIFPGYFCYIFLFEAKGPKK